MPFRRICSGLVLLTLAGCQGSILGGEGEGAPPGTVGPGPGIDPGTTPMGGGFDTKSECQKLGDGIHPGPSPLRYQQGYRPSRFSVEPLICYAKQTPL